MSAVKALKRIDQRSKSLLFGYTREHTRDIPIPITYLCLLYYFQHDKWNEILISPKIKLKDNATIEHIGSGGKCNAFLTKKWSSGKCHWKFQVINLREFWNDMLIGIWEAKHTPPLNKDFTYNSIRGIGEIVNRRNKANGQVLKNGDIIELFVDFDELKMGDKINGCDYYPFDKKDREIEQSEYIVGVTLLMPGDSIKLL